MAFDQSTRGRLQKLVNSCRGLLSDEFSIQLQQTYGLDPKTGEVTPMARLTHLDDRQRHTAEVLRQTLAHYLGADADDTDHRIAVLDRMVREQAFTVLNRLAAILMMEARGQLFESVSKGYQSRGYQLYSKIAGTALGETGQAYQVYLFSVFDELAQELPALFDRYAANGLLFPRETALRVLLDELNHFEIEPLWAADETIGWIYQYFNSKEERKAMRDASQAPRNSRELAVRNQFFTPRYVVEFLVDNTLGRLWFNATGGQTNLRERCQYLLVKPDEQPQAAIKLRDPRTLKLLDPACGSMHFGLYAFDLFAEIYLEAWAWEQQNGPGSLDVSTQPQAALKPLCQTYEDEAAFARDVPRLIIEYNIYGVDIDSRAAQIATLALWLRAQRAWHDQGAKAKDRPLISHGHVVAAIAPPAELELRQQFAAKLDQRDGELFEKTLQLLKGLPELGVLLEVERELPNLIRQVYGGKGTGLFADQEQTNWHHAEARLRSALTEFAQAAKSTYQGRLFAKDALQGLRLIDLSRELFDVVVMNPPFGLAGSYTKQYLKENYPEDWNDYYNVFIRRATKLCIKGGRIGAVVPNRLMYAKKSKGVRELLTTDWSLETLVDAGRDVMDDAAVDAMFFSAGPASTGPLFCPVLSIKETDIQARPKKLLSWAKSPNGFINFDYFKLIPGNSYAYSAPTDFLELWKAGIRLDPDLATVATGGKTFNDERFLRLRWEIIPTEIGSKWVSVDTGGDYQPWYSPSVFVQKWLSDGKEMREFAIARHGTDAQVMQSSRLWSKPGLSYPLTSSIGFGPRIFPSGTILSADSIAIAPNNLENSLPLLAILASSWTSELLSCFGDHRRSENSLVKSLPIILANEDRNLLRNEAEKAIESILQLEVRKETSPLFVSLTSHLDIESTASSIRDALSTIEPLARSAYKISEKSICIKDNSDLISCFCTTTTDEDFEKDFVSYLVGVAFGRWDLTVTGTERIEKYIKNPFSELPSVPPGYAGESSNQILVTTGQQAGLLEKVRSIASKKFGTVSCGLIEDAERLEEYFKKPSGFFLDHLKSYSRGGRRAPIYWPLSTATGSFVLWIYYPNLTSQTLYIGINDFVEPKLKQVGTDVTALRNKGSTRTLDDEKQFESLQAFERDLIELRDTLLKLAPTYKPNHDDGVQISAAPLWLLFRHKPWQKVLKDTWTKLEKGDYDWANMAMNFWPVRVLEKCKTDKSLAIAHSLEHLYVEPDAAPKKTRTKKKLGVNE